MQDACRLISVKKKQVTSIFSQQEKSLVTKIDKMIGIEEILWSFVQFSWLVL